jgi:hypothetical protein
VRQLDSKTKKQYTLTKLADREKGGGGGPNNVYKCKNDKINEPQKVSEESQ